MNNSSKDGSHVEAVSQTASAIIERAFWSNANTESLDALRKALTFVSALHFATDEKTAAQTALEHFAATIEADTWHLYATRMQTGLVANGVVADDSVLAFELLASIDTRKAVGTERSTAKVKPETKSKVKAALSQPSSLALAACEQRGAVSIEQKSRTILSIALRRDERIVGVLEVRRLHPKAETASKLKTKKASVPDDSNKQGASFTHKEAQMLEALCQPLGAALANAARIAEAERLSQIDDLTKLYNARFLRRYLTGEIKRAQRYKSAVAAFFFDIDDFKLINDVHGHLVGSHMLLEMAAVVLSGVRETDMVARYGGDEFVVVLPETNAELAAYVADRVRKRIHAHTFTGGRRLSLKVTASFGVAAYPQRAQSPQQLVHRADHAMYAAKAAGKNCVLIDQAEHTNDEATTKSRANTGSSNGKDAQSRQTQSKETAQTNIETGTNAAPRVNPKRHSVKS